MALPLSVAAAPAPDPAQQRPDIFPCSGCTIQDVDGNGVRDMQDLNPVTLKAKTQRTVSYRLLTMPGCTAGTVPADMVRGEAEAKAQVGFNLVRNDSAYDLTVRINCGSEQIRYCGAVTVFCLGRGFPYNDDVEISDIISTYYADSRLSILLHEIMGHAVGTWNEQYAACGSSCGFASTPNLYDFMNTGPNSRHGYSASELGRWERTMWSLAPDCGSGAVYWNPCSQSWQFSAATCPIDDVGTPFACSWKPSPAPYGQWLGPNGEQLWDYCDPAWGGRHTSLMEPGWFHVGQGFFIDRLRAWTYAPPC